LGEPTGLAERLACAIRHSSWWGRHPVIGFFWLPLLGVWPYWVLCTSILVGIVWLLGHFFEPACLANFDTLRSLFLDPKEFLKYSRPLNVMLNGAASIIMCMLFYRLARRSASGLKWIIVVCAVCSFSGAFTSVLVGPHSISVGSASPNWACAFIPWIVATAAFLRQRRMARRLPAPASPSGSSGGRKRGIAGGLHPFPINPDRRGPVYRRPDAGESSKTNPQIGE
jgi:hypothetical protein